MTPELRFVFDTNALISAALLRRSVSRAAFDQALDQGQILASLASMGELNDVLRRSRFDKYLTEGERVQFLAAFVREAVVIEIVETITACRDAKDDKFLELAVNGKAACLVRGDDDLLVLNPFRGIPIVTPSAFLHMSW